SERGGHQLPAADPAREVRLPHAPADHAGLTRFGSALRHQSRLCQVDVVLDVAAAPAADGDRQLLGPGHIKLYRDWRLRRRQPAVGRQTSFLAIDHYD